MYLDIWGIVITDTSSLTRGRVCNLQLLQYLANAVYLRSEYRGACDRILLSQFWHFFNLEGNFPVFIISLMNRVVQWYARKLCTIIVASFSC
jgi:hypothetical protein